MEVLFLFTMILVVMPFFVAIWAFFTIRKLNEFKEDHQAWRIQVEMELLELKSQLKKLAQSQGRDGTSAERVSQVEEEDFSEEVTMPLASPPVSASEVSVAKASEQVTAPVIPPPLPPLLPVPSEPQRMSDSFASQSHASGELAESDSLNQPQEETKTAVKPVFDLEKWLGLRGAAIGGSLVLALAVIYLFKHSVDQGLLSPPVRLGMGFALALATLGSSIWLRGRQFTLTANSTAGAALIGFYAATWAGYQLYKLLPISLSLVLMVLTTTAGALLSSRFKSQLIALLAMLGGFATPILISTQDSDLLKLFSYLFPLNLGFLFLSRKQKWPILGLVAMVVTLGYQLFSVLMLPDLRAVWLMPLVILVFTFMFAFGNGWRAADTDPFWLWIKRLAFGFGFLTTLPLATSMEIKLDWTALALLTAILTAGACWLGVNRRDLVLIHTAGLGSAFVLALRLWQIDGVSDWLLAGGCLLSLLSFAALPYWKGRASRRKHDENGDLIASALVSLGAFYLLALSLPVFGDPVLVWPWMLFFLILGAIGCLFSHFQDWERYACWGPALSGAGIAFYYAMESHEPTFPPPFLFFALVFLAGLGFQWLGLRSPRIGRPWAERGASAYALVFLLAIMAMPKDSNWLVWHFFLVTLGLGALAAFAAIRESIGTMLFVAMLLTALAQFSFPSEMQETYSAQLGSFVGEFTGVLAFTLFPVLAYRRLAKQTWAWFSAILAAPLWFIDLHQLYGLLFPALPIALLPLVLAAFQLAVLRAILRNRDMLVESKRTPQIWFSASAAFFISIAIPLQLDHEWVTIGWALLGLILLFLWQRFDSVPLKFIAAILFALVGFRLIFYFEPQYPGTGRVFNWLMYGYMFPVMAMIASIRLLGPLEVARLIPIEKRRLGEKTAWLTGLLALTAILSTFVYLNLAVNHFYLGHFKLADFIDRNPARDLTLSIVWVSFAMALMLIAIRKKVAVLRRVSLGFVVLSICKVFLYDLGELSDLYRAASLFGLAVSLILISMIYRNLLREKAE